MATTVLTINSARWLDTVLLFAAVPDVGGAALSENFLLPVGFGDLAIMSITYRWDDIDVLASAAALPYGVNAALVSSDGATVVDQIGPTPIYFCQNTANDGEAFAFADPDALVLWRHGEILNVVAPEIDADATPTSDFLVYIKGWRVPAPAIQSAPLVLVR